MTFWRDTGGCLGCELGQEQSPGMAYLVFLRCAVFLPLPFLPSCVLSVCCLLEVYDFLSSAAFARLPDGKWESFLFCLRDTEHSVAWMPFWVVGTYTYRSLGQTGFCQGYFKLSRISVLCQLTLVSDSQVFWVFRIPKCFHGWC